ncbi:STAS-like domain-containing protein [Methanolapillus ohkumae]|uniref:DUF4325 domain-containing protein n=1 Tax=Methanolapillus ohkumae TaxID=3028298 RepID=A0AA97A703_9EURY|nr:hypothetical protein MsAm2_16170 [Methanosarcinaceae archaeon Am2]
MSSIEKINLANEISPVLFIRESAMELFEKIELNSAKEIVVDFQEINFMSRAFAHEYVVQRRKCSKKISEIHLSKDMEKMIEIVSK